MWDGHELGECWSTEYGVVLRLPVYHFKLEDLPSEIASAPEDDVEADPS